MHATVTAILPDSLCALIPTLYSTAPFRITVMEHPGELVTLQQFEERLWPDVNVAFPENLRTAVKRLREALSDATETPRYIETLPRRGYRFLHAAAPTSPDVSIACCRS